MPRSAPLVARAAGFSLIELLVAMVIGLVVTLAITSVLIRSEGSKRSSTSVNDLNQNGAYVAYTLDRVIRSAGSGFSQRWSDVYGCRLDVSKGTTHVLPWPAAISASSAFATLSNLPGSGAALPLRLAPVLIGKDLANTTPTGVGSDRRGDILLVMGGTAGVGESPQPITPGSAQTSPARVLLQTTLGYRTDDMVLLQDSAATGGCMMQQVATRLPTDSGQTLSLGGTTAAPYYAATGTNVNLVDFNTSAIALQLGNAANNPPQFFGYAVGQNNTLVSLDMLQPLPASPAVPDLPIADGVVEMRALYGLDTTSPPDGVIDTWVDPGAAGYTAAELSDGSVLARGKLRQIIAIRVGLILRTALAERSPAAAASGALDPETYLRAGSTITLFTDMPSALQQTRTLTTAERAYRFRTVEVTIPLRNVLLAPQS